ncbi:hypothetical protein [Paractinoplanes brasiliensis]|uniref:EamA-like transporter family protein n=1 Tax=Paractinoplanes brasiliensis TaxID=52695 RepID=A0A4R6JBF9_9ACTN|nr:hypothetical protein [Actinoplanes brasiliensis]TDO31845.1 hypothetical protein C8E87_7280 [Actinoplanes brasiliensis]
MGLPTLALALVLSSALLHALWNVLLGRTAPTGFDAAIAGNTIGWVALTPFAVARWRVDDAGWGYLAVSAGFSITYFLLLNVAYARAPVHAAYPVARGLAPVLVLLVTLAAGGTVPARAGLGVLVISVGILVTASGASRRSVLAATPVAVSLTCYTYVASRGLEHVDPSTYLWLSMAPLVLGSVTFRLLTKPVSPYARIARDTYVIGLGSVAAHVLTLAALALVSEAQVPAIAALRETGILFVIALSWLTAKAHDARPTPRTALGALFVFAGVAVLALAGNS